MRIWPLDSIKNGILTTGFPKRKNETISPWSTIPEKFGQEDVYCPADAISPEGVNLKKCISCGLCSKSYEPSLRTDNYILQRQEPRLRKSFKIFTVDSGSCGACNTELMAIANPLYDVSRLGIFFTNTPKQADAIVIMGIYNEKMEPVIKAAIEAMSKPSVVILLGACPLSGNILGKGIEAMVDSDLIIGGCPPDPFVIIEALEKVRGKL
ncbi:MAG: NADH-quinone oxidoreductase subunit B family protein [Cuniculiplasma sp.]